MPSRYQQLDSSQIRATLDRLVARIEARFGDRGIKHVAGELREAVDEVDLVTDLSQGRIRRTTIATRIVGALFALAAAVAFIATLTDALRDGPDRSIDWLPLIESSINDIAFAVIAVLFLWGWPERRERKRLLHVLHRLRSLAHIVDMHQLAKDPEHLHADYRPTDQSRTDNLTRSQMHAYLDYCSELLSLVAKAAALCADRSSDSVILDSVSSIETITSEMSREIWQKISLLPN